MENLRRYLNFIRKMDLQDEKKISEALNLKGLYENSNSFPLSSLHFELTESCNAYCKHCYNVSGNNIKADRMTPASWVDFSKYIVEKGGVFECLLSGGEPLLLGNYLFDIMDILSDDGTIFLLMSNGFLLTKEVVTKLKNYMYHWLQLSIDGSSSAYHDDFRGLRGSWDKVIKAAQYVSSADIPLKIAHCVTPGNIDDIDEMCSLAYSLGAKSIMMGGISLSGRVAGNRSLLLSEVEKEILKDKVKTNKEKYNSKMQVKLTNSVKEGLLRHAKRPRSGIIIRPNGDMRIDGMAPFVIGNVLDDDFENIWTQKIDTCWNDERVVEYIKGYNDNDNNINHINYGGPDTLL